MGDLELTSLQIERLARNDTWVQDLARRLVGESTAAQDVVQDAYLIALTSRSRPFGEVRAWFSGVIRNLANDHLRKEARLRQRERRAARGEATVSTAEKVVRLEQQELLIRALLKVPAPFQEALILRYVEASPRTAIAAQLGIPEATVKSRLERGRRHLRATLDAQLGGREVWLAALAPLGAVPTQPAALAGVAALMSRKLIVSAVLLAVPLFITALAIGKLTPPASTPETVSELQGLGESTGSIASRTDAPVLPKPTVEREPVQPETSAIPRPRISGRFINSQGAPVAGVRLNCRGRARFVNATTEVSDADGRFHLELKSDDSLDTFRLHARHESYATLAFQLDAQSTGTPVDLGDIVLRPGTRVTARLLDDNGHALPGYSIGLRNLDEEQPTGRGIAMLAYASGVADAEGRVEFQDRLVPGVWEPVCTRLGAQGVTPKQLSLAGDALEITLVIETFAPIRGRVVFSDGRPFSQLPPPTASTEQAPAEQRFQLGSTYRSRGETLISALGTRKGGLAAGSRLQPDGTFKLTAMRGAEEAVTVTLSDGSDYSCLPVDTTWGDSNVLLVIESKPAIDLFVVDQTTREPITVFGLSLQDSPAGYQYTTLPQSEPGRVHYGGLAAGTHWLYVVPQDGHAARGPIQVETVSGEVTVAVRPATNLDLLVLDSSNKPAVGTRAQLVGVRDGSQLTLKTRITSGRAVNLFPGEGAAVGWDAAQTNDAGRANLAWPELTGWHFYIETTSPSLGRQITPIPTGTTKTTIVFPPSGDVECELLGEWNPETRIWLEPASLSQDDRLGGPFGILMRGETKHDFHGVAPGDWRVIISIGLVEVASPLNSVVPGSHTRISMRADDYLVPAHELDVDFIDKSTSSGTLRLHFPNLKIFGQLKPQHQDLAIENGVCTLPALIPGTYRFTLNGHEASLVLP